MPNSSKLNRRSFLGATSLAMALPISCTAGKARASARANSNLRLGFVGVGSRGHALLQTVMQLKAEGSPIEIAGVCDVYTVNRNSAQAIVQQAGGEPKTVLDYRDLVADESIDAIFVGTPDHWHARIVLDALLSGKHVYCEKPMTRTIDEALEVLRVWKSSQCVMQVGVQCSSLPVWQVSNEWIRQGQLGKVVQYQTEFFRNSLNGQWRNYAMTPSMTPDTIDWDRFLGVEQGITEKRAFDRELFAQWRRFWASGSGMYTDLFVHRVTAMLLATGLRFPARVVGAGGIYLELDGREVPDVATVVADYAEGVQGIVTATMCSEETPLRQLIRGHHGSIVFGNGEEFTGFDFVAERSQVTLDSSRTNDRIETGAVADTTRDHVLNFLEAVQANNPQLVKCSPEVGAAAIVNVLLAVESYRHGKVLHFDPVSLSVSDGNASWADSWEQRSRSRERVPHITGWNGGDKGSILYPTPDQYLAGPWIDGVDPSLR